MDASRLATSFPLLCSGTYRHKVRRQRLSSNAQICLTDHPISVLPCSSIASISAARSLTLTDAVPAAGSDATSCSMTTPPAEYGVTCWTATPTICSRATRGDPVPQARLSVDGGWRTATRAEARTSLRRHSPATSLRATCASGALRASGAKPSSVERMP